MCSIFVVVYVPPWASGREQEPKQPNKYGQIDYGMTMPIDRVQIKAITYLKCGRNNEGNADVSVDGVLDS